MRIVRGTAQLERVLLRGKSLHSTLTLLSCMMDSVPTHHRVIMGVEWDHRFQVLRQCPLQREFIKRGLPLCGYSYLLLTYPDSVIRGDSSGKEGPS